MTTEKLIACSKQFIMGTYNRIPIMPVKGSGARVWDSEGKEYLDFVAGIAVCNLGHCHPKVVEALKSQAERLIHVSNLYYIQPQIEFAKSLIENSFDGQAFFCNSGAEANEAAIKLARKYAHEKRGEDHYELITMENSFHGRTMATVTATGQRKFQIGFNPLLNGFKYVAYNDVAALEAAVTEKTCGVLLEPIQGEGGIKIPDAGYLREVRRICDERGILMILDEVQVGMGRTGKLFAYQHSRIEPDIMTLAKALGNGYPMGAMIAKREVASVFVPGTHASTFGGNPLGMAAGLATLKAMLEDGVLDNCNRMGAYFVEKLNGLKKKHSIIREIRGKGLMIGVELTVEGQDIVGRCREKGLLINCTAGNVLRFVPPLIVNESDIDACVTILDTVIGEAK
jgi:acetylornithine/N-succinyldiaminopimelate aminotransferase